MQEIKKHICSEIATAGIQEIHLLTHSYDGDDDSGTQRMSIKPVRKVINLETYRIKSKVSKEQLQDIEAFHSMGMGNSLDPKALLISALENENAQHKDKLVYDIMKFAGEQNAKTTWDKIQHKLFDWFGYSRKIRIKEDIDLLRLISARSNYIQKVSRISGADFIIVNGAMASRIMNLEAFIYNDPNQPNTEQSVGMLNGYIYKVGVLAGKFSVLINPRLSWNDTSIVMGSDIYKGQEGIYHLEMPEEMEEMEEISPMDFNTNILLLLSQRLAVVPTDNAHLRYYTESITTESYPFIRHIVREIKLWWKTHTALVAR
jgi:hypothetical protein